MDRIKLNEVCGIALLKWLVLRKESSERAFVIMDDLAFSKTDWKKDHCMDTWVVWKRVTCKKMDQEDILFPS